MSQNYTPIDDLTKKLKGPSIHSSSYAKETEPPLKKREAIGHTVEKSEIHEVIEHQVDDEVKPYVSVRKETIELPADLKKIGVHEVVETKFPSYQTVTLPLSDDKVYQGLHEPISSSLRWFAELCLYLLKRSHLTLKNIHGKVIRMVVRK